MKISWRESINKLCGEYVNSVEDKLRTADFLPNEIRELADDFLNYVGYGRGQNHFTDKLVSYAARHGIDDTAVLFDGELHQLSQFLFGKEWAEYWSLFMKAEAESAFTGGGYRRSVRSRRVERHAWNIARELENFFRLRATGLSKADILRGGRTKEEIKELESEISCTVWLTAMLLKEDRECIDWLSEAMTSENNANRMTHPFFRAIAKSGHPGLLELEGKLLLAARLQEGLRQAIVETMDEGRTESYIHLLQVIIDNGLQRYAAVKRGLAVTTGLDESEASERINDKYVTLVHKYVNDRDEARRAVGSHDAMEIYLGLWALAFFNADDVKEPIKELIVSAPSYRVQAAMLSLETLQYPQLCTELASAALRARHDDHAIIAGALSQYLRRNTYRWNDNQPSLNEFFSSRDEAEADFNMLIGILNSMKEDETFSPYVFPWNSMVLRRSNLAERVADIALMLDTPEYIERSLDCLGFIDSYPRAGRIRLMMHKAESRPLIEFAVKGMADRATEVREACCEIAMRLHKEGRLTDSDYRTMEDFLRLKAANMRIAIIDILSSLTDTEATASVSRLLADKTADRRLAALDIIKHWIDKGERTDIVQSLLPEVEGIRKPSSKEKVLISHIIESATGGSDTYNAANGFGLYNPADELKLDIRVPENFDIEKALTFDDANRPKEIMCKVMKIIEENADYEFKDSWGETVRLGNSVKIERYGRGLKALAKPEMWREFYEREMNSPEDLLRLSLAVNDWGEYDEPFFPLCERILGKAFHRESLMDELKDLPYYGPAFDVCRCLEDEYAGAPENLRTATDILSVVVSTVSPDEMVLTYDDGTYRGVREHDIFHVWPFGLLTKILMENALRCDDSLFLDSLAARYGYYRKLGFKKDFHPVNHGEYLRLWNLGKMTDSELWHEMMGREDSPRAVENFTARLSEASKHYQWQKELDALTPEQSTVVRKAVDRILEIELQRGDTPTIVTPLACHIQVVTGIDYFIRILTGMDKDKPTCYCGDGKSKRDMFSHLLLVSCPAEGDTAEELKRRAAEAGISDERLVEAAIFSSRWLELTEKAVGWKGLESAAYYFLAHTGDRLSDNMKSHIARYTSVPPEDFADGAFDPVWFKEVYGQLGKKRFEAVYDGAKYISEGNRHTRARKLSDAALGILKAKDVQKEIAEKRNKDLVVAYGLIPLGRNKLKDLRQRYAALSRFLKESKQFGAQRQASESRAVKLALDNLARTAGFGDSVRLTWSMEADLVKELAEYLSPKEIDGVMLWIELGEGLPELIAESKGKRLQSIPARLKKEKYVVKMREVYGQLKDQHVRGRALLEAAMNDGSEFTGEEIAGLRENPIIWALFSRLVLVGDSGMSGFPGEDGSSLVSASGETIPFSSDDRLRIAHPYDLMTAGVWSDYQSALFDRQWRQPFKQVFRELYLPLEEEKEQSKSMRYAGNQIMPARTVGVLKKRQWVVDYENGLQKVCFNGDVTAVMYAMADWFSPADIEAPTLEYVAFYDRRSFKEKRISDVRPVVFSEIMRDVDLAVSVAHAGGVDPETSHSTIEMRRVIVEHSMPLFGLDNVEVVGNFAKIKGSLGNYNIHLGSGVIHKEGGAQIAVLPVHSQGRGRIFLPFLDEDPKTAEIISKILLFAEDSKIKDPSILNQL